MYHTSNFIVMVITLCMIQSKLVQQLALPILDRDWTSESESDVVASSIAYLSAL